MKLRKHNMNNKKELTAHEWLDVLTNKFLTAEKVALLENCNIKTARKIVEELSAVERKKGDPYICLTDRYLTKYRGTDRKTELQNIYGTNK